MQRKFAALPEEEFRARLERAGVSYASEDRPGDVRTHVRVPMVVGG